MPTNAVEIDDCKRQGRKVPAEGVWIERLNLGHQVGYLGSVSGFPRKGAAHHGLPWNP